MSSLAGSSFLALQICRERGGALHIRQTLYEVGLNSVDAQVIHKFLKCNLQKCESTSSATTLFVCHDIS